MNLGNDTLQYRVALHLVLKCWHDRPPKTKFFFTIIPQPIFLSPGITLTLPIVFRPLEAKEYTDQLWFEKEEGVFCVTLKATLPCYKLDCPSSLQLPMCALGDTVETWFCLNNVGDLPTFFTWEVPAPFQILPTTGLLEPGLGCKIKVTFEPLIAVIHEVEALCWYGKGNKQKNSINIQAAAKCAQLLVSIKHKGLEDQDQEGFQKVVHFGYVSVGSVAERQIRLYNPSAVNAPFKIEMAEHVLTKDPSFSCSTSQGIVPPGEKKCLSLFFHPKTLDSRAIDYFSIIPSGCATKTLLQVVGFCRGPDAVLQHSCVNFHWVKLGERREQTLWIENQSDCQAHFQFDIDCQESVFSIRPAFGTLAGKTRMTLHCAYQPTHPIISFRRVACLIHHQDPLFLDLIGTCHSDSIKPAILTPQHLTWYRTHLARGLTLYPPDILAAMLKEKKLERDEDGALILPIESLPMQELEDLPDQKYPNIPPMTEYFFDGTRDLAIFPPAVCLEPIDVDFGACPGPEAPNPVPLCLRNYTKGKITVVWTGRSDCPFWVTPVTSDVPPLKSIALRLYFQPSSPNCLYAVELEAFAVYKVLQCYSNIEEDCTVVPSWCLKVRARGHSYSPALEHHIPHYSLDSPQTFPAVSPGKPSYRSLFLVNKGSMLMTFSLAPNSSSDITLRPSSGLIGPGAHQVFLISTYPKGTSWRQHIFYLNFNFYPQYLKEVSMQSREEPLDLKLDTHKSIYFKPTWVGCSSTSNFTFHNPSRLPLQFEWRVSQEHQKVLAVQPSKGTIHPNENLTLTWIFSPLEEIKYLFRVGIWVWEARQSQKTKPQATVHYRIRLVGMGVTGCLSAKPVELDFGNVLVNSQEVKPLVLLNDGNCTLYYRLVLEQHRPKGLHSDPCALEFDHSEGTMPPHSQDTIYLTARPKVRSQYSWTISYCLLSQRAPPTNSMDGKKKALCHVSLAAAYPLLSVLDICSMGSTEGITRKHLWHLFSLDTLNSYLARDPTAKELTYKVPTRHSMSRTPPIFTPLKLDFNFGAAPHNALPSVVLLVLKNCGLVPLDWAFLFPSDQQLDLDLWVEQEDLNSNELHQMRAEDNSLFSINPKTGSLNPGQEQMVEFTYRHLFVGTDRLSVLFKVSHGREILLQFIGVTVKLEQKYVHFTSTIHQFIPVPIGDTLPPRQIYELYNGGSVPVTYEVQVSVLSKVQEKNFDHPIFCCLNPKGDIQPGTTARILWIFSPIEAKTYTVEVPIHIIGWNSAVVCFQGVGYDPCVMGDTAPFHSISSWDSSSISSRLMVPGQNVFLSQSHISLGNIPVQSKCSRLFFLNNISKNETIVFTWKPRSLDFGEVTVSPMEGEVGPEEGAPILVTLKASVHASFYSIDLICKVYQRELMRQYHKELQEWNEEKARQEVEFTITDRKVKRRAYCAAHEPPKKYKTLPPITNQPPLNRPATWNLKLAKKETSWPCPQPPVPGLLCLGLTARAHATDYYLANFFSEFPCHFLYRELPKKKSSKEESKSSEELPDKKGPVSRQKQQLLVDCLTSIIRGLLEDKNFHNAVDQNLVEQVPYFCQFWNEQSARFLAQKSSLYLVPILSLPPSYEGRKSKEQEEDLFGKMPGGQEDDEEEEEDEEEAEEEEEEIEEEMSKDEEDIDKDAKMTWSGIKVTETSQHSLQWQWQQDLKTIIKEETESDEKEAIGRLPAFANLQEAILENMIQNILVEASRGEVVLTSRPRIIALPPVSMHRTDNLLQMSQGDVLCSGMQHPDCLLVSASSPSNMTT
ncbi:cilia- and flagella-associated protein 65 isoform X4 [Mus musculus]|uniref:cilia- and flagella-associated protein 65 isoform X4 n=1 Tax=Mus musculus TaxID=10090 RepID=UPI0003D71545|nr:cilia- and flagella-associated protein 65 isoform X4 [Mus musculus]|eukprot:XP_006496055.1 PREDICTED: coiled-coil domain-containing protein 108 isoform X4 [Mus musculus]